MFKETFIFFMFHFANFKFRRFALCKDESLKMTQNKMTKMINVKAKLSKGDLHLKGKSEV